MRKVLPLGVVMKFKRNALLEVQQGLLQAGNLTGIKLVYAIAKNTRMIASELKAMERLTQQKPDYTKYDQERLKLCKEMCVKDEKGVPIIQENSYAGLTGTPDFEKRLKALKKKHQKAVDGREKDMEEYNKLLDEEVEIDIHMVNIKFLPPGVTAQQLTGIMFMIQGEPPKDKKEGYD